MLLKYVIISIFIISLGGIFLSFHMVIYGIRSRFIIILALLFLLLSFFSILLLMYLAKHYFQKLNISYQYFSLQEQNSLQRKYLENLQELSQETDLLKKKYMDDIMHIYELIYLNKLDSAEREYIQLHTEYENLKIIQYCKNPVINAMLFIKHQDCLDKKIKLDISLSNLKNLSIDDSSLVSILSNLIDNAIEAQQYINTDNHPNKWIQLKTREEVGHLFLSVSNSKLPNQTVTPNHSSKKNSEEHGYGLQIVEDIIHSYNGTFDINSKEDSVEFFILIETKNTPND